MVGRSAPEAGVVLRRTVVVCDPGESVFVID